MKKMLSVVLSILLLGSLFSCAKEEKDYSQEFRQLYTADEYYEEQQQEIEAIVKEYAEKLQTADESKDMKADQKTAAADEMKSEFAEKISEIDKKDMVDAKKYAEEFFAYTKTLILPYEIYHEYLKEKYNYYDGAKTAEEIVSAVDKMKKALRNASGSLDFDVQYKNSPFHLNIKCGINSAGYPELTFTSDKEWSSLKIPNNGFFSISVSTILNQDCKNLEDTVYDRISHTDTVHELNRRTYNVLYGGGIRYINAAYNIKVKDNTYYSYADGAIGQQEVYTDDPQQAGISYSSDGMSFVMETINEKHDDIFKADGSYTNTFGNIVSKDESLAYDADCIVVMLTTWPAVLGLENDVNVVFYVIPL